jgi:hypothetical protein
VRSQGAERVGSEERGGFPYGSQPVSHCDEVISRCRMGDADPARQGSLLLSAGQPIGRAAYYLRTERTVTPPFNTGCSPMSYSGNPGASGVSYSGAVYLAAAGHAQNARSRNRSLAGTGKGRTLSWPQQRKWRHHQSPHVSVGVLGPDSRLGERAKVECKSQSACGWRGPAQPQDQATPSPLLGCRLSMCGAQGVACGYNPSL